MPKIVEKKVATPKNVAKKEVSNKAVKSTPVKVVKEPAKKEIVKPIKVEVTKPVKKEVVKQTKKDITKPVVKSTPVKAVKEPVKPTILAKSKKETVEAKKVVETKTVKRNKVLFKVTQKYEYEDILKLMKYYFYNLRNNQILFKYFQFIFIFTGVMFLFMEIYLLSLFCFIILLVYPLAINRELERTSRTEFESNKLYSLENRFSFYDDYFEVENDQSKSQIFFHQLHDLVEVEDSYYLFISANQAFVIKKNSIDENFFNYIKEKPRYHVVIQKTKRLFR